jgi:hypothetical protein
VKFKAVIRKDGTIVTDAIENGRVLASNVWRIKEGPACNADEAHHEHLN